VGCGPTRSFSSTSSSAAPTGVVAKSGSTVLERGRSAPGATSGLVGVAQFLLGAAAAPLPGAIGGATLSVLPTAAVVLGALVLATAALVGPARRRPA
jgi:MFS transporter, DHA1 family, multidrug resistance protein